VTGANSGIGFEAARDLVGRGANVVLAVRNTAKGENAATRLAGARLDERRQARPVRPRPGRGLRRDAARSPMTPALQTRAEMLSWRPLLLTRRASSGRWPPTTWGTPRWWPPPSVMPPTPTEAVSDARIPPST